MLKDIDIKCEKYTYNGRLTLYIKFVCEHFYYGTRCWFMNFPRRGIPDEYMKELTTFTKLAINKWVQKVPS